MTQKHTAKVQQNCKRGMSAGPRVRAGLTLIETATVVMTVTCAASVLLPSLSRSREGERSAVCLNHLKLFGRAIQQYVADNRGSLPGPTTMNVPYQSGRYFFDSSVPQPSGQKWYQMQLTSYLQPYLNVDSAGGKPADELAFCPTSEGITRGETSATQWFYKPRTYYICNSISYTMNRSGSLPYYGTTPKYYFGAAALDIDPSQIPADQMPKRLDAIANVSREWAMADLWYSQYLLGRDPSRRMGTWPYDSITGQSSGHVYDSVTRLMRVPTYAFHQTTKTYPLTPPPSSPPDDPRNTAGSTNATYFDGHAASVRPWIGSVNPCFTSSCD